jgi:hypothetical protein
MASNNEKPRDLQFILKPSSKENYSNLRSQVLSEKPGLVVYGVPEATEFGFEPMNCGL